MGFESMLGETCTIEEEIETQDEIGAVNRTFENPVTAKCRLNSRRGMRNDLELGQVLLDNLYVLYLMPDVEISKAHRVTARGANFKVNNVRELRNGGSNVHHLEVDLEAWT